jgi:hypothetical protein
MVVAAAKGLAPTSSSVLYLGFELTSFIFIDIMAKMK